MGSQVALPRELLCRSKVDHAYRITALCAGIAGQVPYFALALSLEKLSAMRAAQENDPRRGLSGAMSGSSKLAEHFHVPPLSYLGEQFSRSPAV